jgi:tetratricopeptide (TPR) repeat protein
MLNHSYSRIQTTSRAISPAITRATSLAAILTTTAAALASLLIALPPAQAVSLRAARPPAANYQPLKPFEDLSTQEDALEIYDRAVTAFNRQQYDEAERLFKRVLQLAPKNADAKYNLGAIAEWRNNLHKALSLYKEALALKPTDRDFARAVSDVQLKIQLAAESREYKRQEGLVEAGQKAKTAFAAGDYYESARQLEQLAKVFPNEPKVHYALGQSLRALKVYEWSAYHLKMAIFLEPDDDTYHRALVDLDQEIQLAQEQALNDSVQFVLSHMHPLSGGELAACGGQL